MVIGFALAITSWLTSWYISCLFYLFLTKESLFYLYFLNDSVSRNVVFDWQSGSFPMCCLNVFIFHRSWWDVSCNNWYFKFSPLFLSLSCFEIFLIFTFYLQDFISLKCNFFISTEYFSTCSVFPSVLRQCCCHSAKTNQTKDPNNFYLVPLSSPSLFSCMLV